MAQPLQLVWDLLALDNASGVFKKVGAAADATAVQTSGMGKAFATAGAAVAVAAIGVGVVTAKMAATFQSSMMLIQTQAGASSDEVASMSKAILDLAGPVATAPEALALSLYHVESVGLRGAQALEVVKIAAEGAKIGNADLEQVTNALTASVASGIPGVQNMTQAMGQLNTIVGAGDMKMQDLNEALGSGLLTVVKGFGLNLSDVGAALATFGDNNIRGADAATQLRMAVQAMAKPVKGGEKTLQSLGIATGQLAKDMQEGGLNKALTDLRDHMDKAGVKSNEVGQVILDAFGKKAGVGIAVLEGQMPRFETKLDEIKNAGNSFGSDWEKWLGTVTAKWDGLKAQLEAIAIKIGTALLPVVASMIDKVSHFTTEFENGTGAGGKFRDALVEINDRALKPMAAFITGTALPALVSIAAWIKNEGVPGLQSFIQWVKDNKTTLGEIAGLITLILMPALIHMGATAVASAAAQAGAWISTKVEAVTSAVAQVGAHYTAGLAWINHAIVATASAAGDAGAWISLRVEAATSAASEVASHALGSQGWIAHAAAAVLAAAGDVGAWISLRVEAATSAASEFASHLLGKEGWIVAGATAVASAATQIGAWIATSDTAMASGIRMAAAWVIALGPVAWVIAALVAVGAGLVWLYGNVKWFHDGVDIAFRGIADIATWLWNNALQPMFKLLVDAFANAMRWVGDLFDALGKVPGFGWAKDAADKMHAAADKVDEFANSIRKIPPTANVSINVTANYSAAAAAALGAQRAGIKLAGFAAGGTIDPTPGGTAIRVAEAGRAETVVDTATLNRAMAQRNTPQAAPNVAVYVQAIPNGEYVRQEAMVAINGASASSIGIGRQMGAAR